MIPHGHLDTLDELHGIRSQNNQGLIPQLQRDLGTFTPWYPAAYQQEQSYLEGLGGRLKRELHQSFGQPSQPAPYLPGRKAHWNLLSVAFLCRPYQPGRLPAGFPRSWSILDDQTVSKSDESDCWYCSYSAIHCRFEMKKQVQEECFLELKESAMVSRDD